MIERDYLIERNVSGTVELSRAWNVQAKHWRVRITIRDERAHQMCHFFVAVKLWEDASKDEVYEAAGPVIEQWFGKLHEWWLPCLKDIVKPPNRINAR